MGSHPAIIHLLKRVFHSRPPHQGGMIIRHIKKLGPNEKLNTLILKTAMLLVLTRSSHSADLSKLHPNVGIPIRWCARIRPGQLIWPSRAGHLGL